jgi:hypothetical protein
LRNGDGNFDRQTCDLALKELPQGRLLDDTVVSILQRRAQRDMDGATAWVEQFPEGALRAAAVENLMAQWSPTDPEGAQRWRVEHFERSL